MCSLIDITVEAVFDGIKIRFNNILHLYIRRPQFLGLQSWIHESKYCIEYTMADGVILCEYDKIEYFQTILAALDKIL